jgi:hypothetical protein
MPPPPMARATRPAVTTPAPGTVKQRRSQRKPPPLPSSASAASPAKSGVAAPASSGLAAHAVVVCRWSAGLVEASYDCGLSRRYWARPAIGTGGGLAAFTALTFLTYGVLRSGGNQVAAAAPEFWLWCALVAASAVLYALLFAHTLPEARGWRKRVDVAAWKPLTCYLLFAAALLTFLWGRGAGIAGLQPDTALPISQVLTLLGVVAAGPAVLGLWLVYARLRRISALLTENPAESRQAADVLGDLLDCRRAIGVCLTTMAVIVTTAVVDAGAQRKAFLATGTPAQRFQPEVVLMYGGFFTVVSMALFIPIFVAWRGRCHRFIDAIYPLPADARPSEDWMSGRSRLAQLLGTEQTVAKTLAAAFGILAPLATSVLSVVIPGLK